MPIGWIVWTVLLWVTGFGFTKLIDYHQIPARQLQVPRLLYLWCGNPKLRTSPQRCLTPIALGFHVAAFLFLIYGFTIKWGFHLSSTDPAFGVHAMVALLGSLWLSFLIVYLIEKNSKRSTDQD